MWSVISGEKWLCNSKSSLTGDFSMSDVLRATGEDQFSVLPTRQWAVLDAVIEDVSFAVFPLQSNALIRLLHCLEVLRGIQVWNISTCFLYMSGFTAGQEEHNCLSAGLSAPKSLLKQTEVSLLKEFRLVKLKERVTFQTCCEDFIDRKTCHLSPAGH